MQLKSCSIDIKADIFTATTFIEMEFYNPNKKEIEGLHQFMLNPEQVITAFQLDLNGKYRDGSIEEKWKATNTYNAIVGKRIDPALLTMDYAGHYNLRIYPIPAKSSRKVTMTIQQLLAPGKQKLSYSLPLNIRDTVSNFLLSIAVTANGMPTSSMGLIADNSFISNQNQHSLSWQTENIALNKALTFSIPLTAKQSLCTKKENDKTYFALLLQPSVAVDYAIHPKQVTVFWDASVSSNERNRNKEINFLKQFISNHKVEQLTIIPFNHKILDTAIFNTNNNAGKEWRQYLQNLSYDGATQLGLLDMTSLKADMFLLFSDGNNTYGNARPKTGNSLVSCIYTSANANLAALQQITGANGGKSIDLNKISMTGAISSCSRATNWLMDITSSSSKVTIAQSLPLKPTASLLVNGTLAQSSDTIYFHYGNNGSINFTEKILLRDLENCPSSPIDRLSMLNNFDKLIRSYSWSDIIDYGLKEKVVTPYTAYIVLERVEDYIKYNITPPKELEAECERMNYVKRDTRFERRKIEKMSDYDILNKVVNAYNERIKKWDEKENPIYLERDVFDKYNLKIQIPEPSSTDAPSGVLEGKVAGLTASQALNEVVVTGYGLSLKKNVTGAVSYIQRQDIFSSATSVEQALQGRVAGVQVTSSGTPGNTGTISIRGAATLSGNRQPLMVVDGVPISGNINDAVNVADIEYISILKDASAASIYGRRAANGAIIIVTKKGRRYYGNSYNTKLYKLEDMEDVEYMQEIKSVPVGNKEFIYEQLKNDYGNEPGFYLDMAQHFFTCGFKEKALNILMNAAEATNGSKSSLIAIAYMLESYGMFEQAISIYKQLAVDDPLNLVNSRNLAWAYYQSGMFQQAVDNMYAAIKKNTEQQEYVNVHIKSLLLYEMNALISMHKKELDISTIPALLIKSLPVDMRIIIDCNNGSLGNVTISEPGGHACSYMNPSSKNGGLMDQYSYWNYNGLAEYSIKKAVKGKFRIIVNHYSYYTYSRKTPSIIRIRKFKNFGQENQSIETENVMMDNQYGEIEIGEMKW